MSWLWTILIGMLAGYAAGVLMKGKGFGLIVNLIVGLVGGWLGGWLFGIIGLGPNNIVGSLIAAVVGAVLLLYIISLFKRK